MSHQERSWTVAGGLPIPAGAGGPGGSGLALPEAIRQAIERWWQTRWDRAIVVANDGNQVEVRRVGYADADGQTYAKLDGVTVVADDEVLMLDLTGVGGWIVLGKILRN